MNVMYQFNKFEKSLETGLGKPRKMSNGYKNLPYFKSKV